MADPNSAAHAAPVEARPFTLGHRPALDGLRGLAILAVMGLHCVPMYVKGGMFGVDVFFVLSGFLITALLLEERRGRGSIDLKAFYLRRVLRLLPAVLLLLLVCWLAALLAPSPGGAGAVGGDAISILLYYYNWAVVTRPFPPVAYLAHLWSLSLEEQFYMVWPPVLALLLAFRVRQRWVLSLALLGAAAPVLERLLLYRWYLDSPLGLTRLYVGTDSHCDGLFGGAVVALLAYRGLAPRSVWARRLLAAAAWPALLIVAAHCLFTPTYSIYPHLCGFAVVNLCTVVLIASLIWAPPPVLGWCLERRWLGWLGRVSYGLYLWNCPVFLLVTIALSGSRFRVRTIACFAAAIAVAAISYYCLERPFLRLKQRWTRRAAPSVPPAPADARRAA